MTWAAVQRRIQERRTLGPLPLRRRQQSLLKELGHLSDRISRSIREDDRSSATEGLGLLQVLMVEAATYHASRQQGPQYRLFPVDGPGIHSREWHELMQTLVQAQEAAAVAQSRRLRIDVLKSVFRTADALMSVSQFAPAHQVIAAIGWLWSDIDAEAGNWDAEDADYFFMRLREAATFSVPRTADRDVVMAAGDVFLTAMAAVAKTSIDRRHWPNVVGAIETLREAHPGLPSDAGYGRVGVRAQALGLLLLAWILMTREEGQAQDAELSAITEVHKMFTEDRALWSALQLALDDSFQHTVGARGWEMGRRMVRGRGGGAIEIDHYVRIAALEVAGATFADLAVDLDSDVVADQAWMLNEVLQNLAKHPVPAVSPLFPNPLEHPWREALLQAVERRDARRHDVLAATPLDPERIESFRAAIDRSFDSSSSVLDMLAPVHLEEGLAPNFGFNKLEQKFFFAQSDVFADPADLAENMVAGLKRGEDGRLADLLSQVTQKRTRLSGLSKSLTSWLQRQGASEVVVVLTNSWRSAEALRLTADEGGDSYGDSSRLRFAEVQVVLVRMFDSNSPFVAALAPGAVAVRRGIVTPTGEDGEHVHHHRLLSVVRAPTPDEVARWSTRDDLTPADMRQLVVVKLLEALSVELGDRRAISVWTVDEEPS